MVFLSSTKITGNPASGFSSHPGFVSGFIDGGASSVVVNFWAGDAESDEVFVTDFYRSLKESGDILSSLHNSRLRYLRKNRIDSLYDWAGYQMYIR